MVTRLEAKRVTTRVSLNEEILTKPSLLREGLIGPSPHDSDSSKNEERLEESNAASHMYIMEDKTPL